ncbi:S-adenosyl-L-methionine-dependent methyltransferase [Globomyces pollinis-pini]|nr:S-adenosyl-L-methionine-dependent methyltransferase [Globomyces pollinis-pini]
MTTSTLPTPVQDPQADDFLIRLRKKNTDSAAHKNTVDSYNAFWDQDHKNGIQDTEESVAKRREGSDKLTNHYYDLVTDFYEYGWGSSFHFAVMYNESTFQQSISRHEDYLALKLNLKPDQVCLDVGCGVGGPMREVARFSGAKVVGLNNNEYQVARCGYLANKFGLSNLCKAVKGDFENMPFPENSFDAAYAVEATCHSRNLENPYKEIFRTLKPGGYFACYEWLTTANYDETNMDHKTIMHALEEGNSIPRLSSIPDCLNALKAVGFEIQEYCDLADPSHPNAVATKPWYSTLKGTYNLDYDSLVNFRMTPIGQYITDKMVWSLETLRLAPSGTHKISQLLMNASRALVAAGEQNLFTPMFFFLVRKPLDTETPDN